MSLTLVKRASNGAPISAIQHDANMTAIEASVNANAANIATNTTDISNRLTITDFDAAFEGDSLSGKKQVDYANILNVPVAVDVNTYPASAYTTADFTLAADGSLVKITTLNSVSLNPDGKYDTSLSRYVAHAYGIYMVAANFLVTNDTATASGMELALRTAINSDWAVPGIPANGVSVASPPGSRWWIHVSGLITLNTSDNLELFVSAQDGVGSGNVKLSSGTFSIFKVK